MQAYPQNRAPPFHSLERTATTRLAPCSANGSPARSSVPPGYARVSLNRPVPGTILCAVTDVPDGQARAFAWGTGDAAFALLVLRTGERVNAYVNSCPHFDIPLDNRGQVATLRGEVLMCGHHDAVFRFSDGACIEGPCEGESLARMPIEIVDGRIRIAALDAPAKPPRPRERPAPRSA